MEPGLIKTIPQIKIDGCPDVASPTQFKKEAKTDRSHNELPLLPKLTSLDVDCARAIVYSMNTVLMCIPSHDNAVKSGSLMLKQVLSCPLEPSTVYETISTVLTRAVRLPVYDTLVDVVKGIELVDKKFKAEGKQTGEQYGRYCLARAIYRKLFQNFNRKNTVKPVKSEAGELVPSMAKLTVDDAHLFKTPKRKPTRKPSPYRGEKLKVIQ